MRALHAYRTCTHRASLLQEGTHTHCTPIGPVRTVPPCSRRGPSAGAASASSRRTSTRSAWVQARPNPSERQSNRARARLATLVGGGKPVSGTPLHPSPPHPSPPHPARAEDSGDREHAQRSTPVCDRRRSTLNSGHSAALNEKRAPFGFVFLGCVWLLCVLRARTRRG